MGTVLDNLSTKFNDTVVVSTKMAGVGTAISRMATALSTPATHTLSNEVNYRPAVQQ